MGDGHNSEDRWAWGHVSCAHSYAFDFSILVYSYFQRFDSFYLFILSALVPSLLFGMPSVYPLPVGRRVLLSVFSFAFSFS